MVTPSESAITFKPLLKDHLPLLLKWLETPHVKAWWDQDVHWTPQEIENKYGSYIQGYKVLKDGSQKSLSAFIVYEDQTPIGYIQSYNAYDFPREDDCKLEGLPGCLAAIDFYIGDPLYVSKGFGPTILKKYLKDHIWPHFEACFVDPDPHNKVAIRCYEKAGFKKVSQKGSLLWMISERKNENTKIPG